MWTSFKKLVSKETTIWRLKNLTVTINFFKNNVFQLSHGIKNIEASCIYTQWSKFFLQLLLLKVCESFRLGQLKKPEVHFGLYESTFTLIEKRRPNKYCLFEVN